jgi:hypothetical protein
VYVGLFPQLRGDMIQGTTDAVIASGFDSIPSCFSAYLSKHFSNYPSQVL